MTRLPASFDAWCFMPAQGVVKIHVMPTTLDAETAEVMEVSSPVFERGHLYVAPSPEEQARMDDAACFALDLFCLRLGAGESIEATEEHVEKTTLAVADLQQERWLSRKYTHPDDATLPAWME